MRTFTRCVFLACMIVAAPCHRAEAWGFTAHRYIAERAIARLPPELRAFFEKYRTTVIEHSIDPDTYRTMGFSEEPPRHFLDMDAYGAFPFRALPHDYKVAVARFGRDFVTRNGLLPWRIQEIYDRLADAFTQTGPYARDDIKLFSAVIAHYVSDAFQPFHAAVNYDGQLTNQHGIHARFETELFERYEHALRVTTSPLNPVQDAREFAFATLTDSFRLVDSILAADRAATHGRTAYDDAYFESLFERTRNVLEARISGAIDAVASVITGAWQKAGKPVVPENPPVRPPRPIRRGRV